MRKALVAILLFLLCWSVSLWSEDSQPVKTRFGLLKIVEKNINPMEVFLLENEIVNNVINNFNAEVVKDIDIQQKLTSLGEDKCDTDQCRLKLAEQLNLDYLIASGINHDSNGYHLELELFQEQTGFTFTFVVVAKSFNNLKKALTTSNQLIKSVISTEKEERKNSAKKREASEIEKERREVLKGINQFEQELDQTKKEIKKLEKQINRVQRRFTRLIKKNPELEETYLEVLRLYLPEAEKKDEDNDKE